MKTNRLLLVLLFLFAGCATAGPLDADEGGDSGIFASFPFSASHYALCVGTKNPKGRG